jgi:hypothetical protein
MQKNNKITLALLKLDGLQRVKTLIRHYLKRLGDWLGK